MNTHDWHASPSLPARRRRRATGRVIGPRLTDRILLLDRRLHEAVPEDLTDDDQAAIEELLETVRALARAAPSGPPAATRRRRRSPAGSRAAPHPGASRPTTLPGSARGSPSS